MSNSNVLFQEFVRKQFPVRACRVTPLNMKELAEECGGTIRHDGVKEEQVCRDYIKVRTLLPINEKQTQAHIGDWLVLQGRNWKVYTDRAFRGSFEFKDGTPVEGGEGRRDDRPKADWVPTSGRGKQKNRSGVAQQQRPNPGQMPKKRAEGPREKGVPEQGDKMVGQSHSGITSTQAIADEQAEFARRMEGATVQADPDFLRVRDEIVDLTLQGAPAEVLQEKIDESIQVIDRVKPKSITLDELNAQSNEV